MPQTCQPGRPLRQIACRRARAVWIAEGLPKNSAFIQLDESNSAFIRAGNVVAASISKEFDGWHVNATYERGNYKAFTLFSPEIYPDKEHAIAALHDFMERLAAR